MERWFPRLDESRVVEKSNIDSYGGIYIISKSIPFGSRGK